jgi:hypothetical protein
MQEKGISNKVTEAWALEDIYIIVNGTEICDIDIVGFEAIFGGCNIPAQLQFIDSKGLTTGDTPDSANISVGGIVEIGFTTAQGCDWSDEFVIKKVNTDNNSKNQKLVTLTLEDLETRNLKGSYVSKGYPNKKFSEAMESQFEELGNDALRKKKKFEVLGPKEEKRLNIVVPANINFYDYLNKEMKDKNYTYVKDKHNSYLIHDENREYDKLKSLGDVYEYDTNQFSFTRIVQFNIEGFDMDAYLASIPTQVTSIDSVNANSEDSKDGVDSKISVKDPSKEIQIKTSGVNPGDLAKVTRGKKQGHKTANDKQYFETISNAQKCSIWAPGRTDNMVGRKIEVSFPKPSYYAGTDNDKIFSGEWEVYMVRDKIIGMYYMQELFLRRPGGSNK